MFRPPRSKNRSPTDSIESRLNWAVKQRAILDMNHRSHPPTHFAVIKFTSPARVVELKTFQRRARQSLAYFQRTTGKEFAVFGVLEIEPNNCCHYHLLIRTSEPDPAAVLRKIVQDASKGLARLGYCKKVKTVVGATKYVVKDILAAAGGKKTPRLLKKRLGLRLASAWNGYFVPSKRQLWEEWKREKYGESAHAAKQR